MFQINAKERFERVSHDEIQQEQQMLDNADIVTPHFSRFVKKTRNLGGGGKTATAIQKYGKRKREDFWS